MMIPMNISTYLSNLTFRFGLWRQQALQGDPGVPFQTTSYSSFLRIQRHHVSKKMCNTMLYYKGVPALYDKQRNLMPRHFQPR